jgi:hypothetical protein
MPDDFNVSTKNDFYIAIAKQGIHSFIMLGVTLDDGSHRLIARVGKTDNLDPDFGNPLKMALKEAQSIALTRLASEGISRPLNREQPIIHYQAYAINFQQAQQCLELLHEIERTQLENDALNAALNKLKHEEHKRIFCYIPTAEGDKITFKYKKLEDAFKESPRSSSPKVAEIAMGAQQLNLSNTCRTTALSILEEILGFKTQVSTSFLVAPRYRTTLVAGQPHEQTFYILPLPPTAYPDVNKRQVAILTKLYQRLEAIPLAQGSDLKTKNKFEQLKKLYVKIAGENTLDAGTLLTKIKEHEAIASVHLYARRSSNWFTRFFNVPTTTEQVLSTIKTSLENEAKDKASDLSPKSK